eukprot:1527432-Pleurochrysis_carterae.AAC.1
MAAHMAVLAQTRALRAVPTLPLTGAMSLVRTRSRHTLGMHGPQTQCLERIKCEAGRSTGAHR